MKFLDTLNKYGDAGYKLFNQEYFGIPAWMLALIFLGVFMVMVIIS